MHTTTMMFLYRQGKCNAPIKYGVKTMNKVIVDIVNDFELKNIGFKISQPKNFVSVRVHSCDKEQKYANFLII